MLQLSLRNQGHASTYGVAAGASLNYVSKIRSLALVFPVARSLNESRLGDSFQKLTRTCYGT